MKYGAVCLCIILFQQMIYAQSTLSSGFILTKSNDTLRGKIRDKDWDISPNFIEFSNTDSSDLKRYTPDSISGFGLDGKYLYTSKKVVMDISSLSIDKLMFFNKNDTVKFRTVTKQVFLNILVLGRMSLYFQKDETGKEHFFVKKDTDTLTEIVLQKYLSTGLYSKELHTVERYKFQLRYLMSDCSQIADVITKAGYNESDLTELVIKYNKCFSSDQNTYIKPSEKSNYRIGIIAGIGSTNLSFSGLADDYYLQEVLWKPSVMGTFGLSYTIPIQKSFQRHIFYTELLFKTINISGTMDNLKSFKYPTNNATYTFNLKYLKSDFMYRYAFIRTGKTDFFVNFGASASYAIQNENRVVGTTNYKGPTHNIDTLIFSGRDLEIALLVGAGVSLRHFSFEIRHERGDGMSPFPELISSLKSYYCLLGYNF